MDLPVELSPVHSHVFQSILIIKKLLKLCSFVYRKGLDATETAFAMRIYSSHCKIGSPAKIKRLMGEEALET